MTSSTACISSFKLASEFLPHPEDELGESGLSWGRFRLLVDGRDLFVRSGSEEGGMEWNLCHLWDFIEEGIYGPNGEDLDSEDWRSALDYATRLDHILYFWDDEDRVEHERERRSWIREKNLACIGQGTTAPSIYIVVDEGRGYVEMSWNQKENYLRGWMTPPTNVLRLSLPHFEDAIEAFRREYREFIVSNVPRSLRRDL